MNKLKTIVNEVLAGVFVSSFSVFELLGLFFITRLVVDLDSLWWLLLYLPLIIISVLAQRHYDQINN